MVPTVALCAALAGAQVTVRGVVVDPTGAAVANATVVLAQGTERRQTRTGADGTFALAGLERGELTVSAPGFAAQTLRVESNAAELRVQLSVQADAATVTVVSRAGETALSEAQQSVVVFLGQQVTESPTFPIDETLRQVPGFSLFRRSSSLTANPTSQGVSLRGIGASGASRALVLFDGVPLNDAFGGWVYWDRIPRLAVQQVEVLEGGASQLYGSTALSGVMSIETRPRTQSFVAAEFSGGPGGSPQGSFATSMYRAGWGLRGSGAGYQTEGYIPTVPSQRGAVDTRAASESKLVDLELNHTGRLGEFQISGSYFTEGRDNGTPLQKNATELAEVRLRWQRPVGSGPLTLHLFGNGQTYDQTFSAVATDRASESLTRDQHVPSQRIGGSAVWASQGSGRHGLVLGLDAQAVRGFSHEIGFSSGSVTVHASAGGEQRSFGAFAQDTLRIGNRGLLTLGLRGDHWANTDAKSITQPASTGIITRTALPEKTETFLSPRISGLWRLTDLAALTFSVHRAFRAPTLNELYRGFRLGNVQTNANASLRAEDLVGGEAGILLQPGRVSFRATGFLYEVRDPIANVTLSVTPSLIVRQRRNLGRNQTAGAEFTGHVKLTPRWELRAAYQYAASTVERFPANAALEGLQVPQVPRHGFTFSTVWRPRAWSFQLQGRFHGNQFDDDQNLLRLGRAAVIDASIAREWRGGLRTFVSAQNLLDDRYAIALTPVRQAGIGVTVRAGVQFRLPRRQEP